MNTDADFDKPPTKESALRAFEERNSTFSPMAEKDFDKLLTEIKDIRKKLWKGYAHRVF